jgi:hypothetical protein
MTVKGSFLVHVKPTVTITRPTKTLLSRGVLSDVNAPPRTTVRIPSKELSQISKACEALGLNKSEFIRWCATEVAVDILKQKAMYEKLVG